MTAFTDGLHTGFLALVYACGAALPCAAAALILFSVFLAVRVVRARVRWHLHERRARATRRAELAHQRARLERAPEWVDLTAPRPTRVLDGSESIVPPRS